MSWHCVVRLLRDRARADLVPAPDPKFVDQLVAALDATSRARLGRGLALFQFEAGDCGGCAAELEALQTVRYDLERFGLRFVATPRHADVLLVSGALTCNLREALELAHEAMPDPKWVVGIGDCAADGGIFKGSYAVVGGVGQVLPVDMVIPGCPPSPLHVLAGLRALLAAG